VVGVSYQSSLGQEDRTSHERTVQVIGKLGVAIAPLVLALLLAWLLMEGPFSFGGGEKDVILAVPLLIWAIIFLCAYTALSRKRPLTALRPIGLAAGVATVIVAIAWVLLFGVSVYLGR